MERTTETNHPVNNSNSVTINGPRFISTFTTRYGKEDMQAIWDDRNKAGLIRDVWIAQSKVYSEVGLVTPEEVDDLIANRDNIDVDEINSREMDRNNPKYTGHDILAHISQYADVAPLGARAIHAGGDTSEDILSNVEVIQIRDSLNLIEAKVVGIVFSFRDQVEKLKNLVAMGYTHDQAAEPLTFGFRLARYGQDFLIDLDYIRLLQMDLRTKGLRGPIGTSAGQMEFLEGIGMSAEEHEAKVMQKLGLIPALVTGQAYPRKFTLLTMMTLALIAQSTHKFAKDVKTLQASNWDEASEPRAKGDKSSSSMMHKRNPRHSENIKALSRRVRSAVIDAWDVAADESLERGLEDSAGKREFLPTAFLATDECLYRTKMIIDGLLVNETRLSSNVRKFAAYAALEPILVKATKNGGHRQEIDSILRELATTSILAVTAGEPNPLVQLLRTDPRVGKYLTSEEIDALLNKAYTYIGNAPQICDRFIELVDRSLTRPTTNI